MVYFTRRTWQPEPGIRPNHISHFATMREDAFDNVVNPYV